MKRGDVVIAATGGSYGGKPRPYVVIQADAYVTRNVVMVGCTTSGNGPALASEVMIDLPIAARREKVSEVVGTLAASEMATTDAALIAFLGLR